MAILLPVHIFSSRFNGKPIVDNRHDIFVEIENLRRNIAKTRQTVEIWPRDSGILGRPSSICPDFLSHRQINQVSHPSTSRSSFLSKPISCRTGLYPFVVNNVLSLNYRHKRKGCHERRPRFRTSGQYR